MKHRKTKARRNRYFTWKMGNSKSSWALFTSGKLKEEANAKEGLKEVEINKGK